MTDAHEVSTQLSQMSRGPADPWRSQDLRTSPDDEAPTRRALATAEAAGEALPPPGPVNHQGSEAERIQFIQAAKGAPASVLLALGWSGRYMSHQELMDWTRCGHRQVTLALQSLKRAGWVSAKTSRGPWRLCPGRRLPLEFSPQEGSAPGALNDDDSLSTKEESIQSALRGQILEALREYKIMEPTASRIADLPYVTVDYIRNHVDAVLAEHKRVGLAITRILMGAPEPPSQAEVRAAERVQQETDLERRIRLWPFLQRAQREVKEFPESEEAQKRANLHWDDWDPYFKTEEGQAWLAADPGTQTSGGDGAEEGK